MVSSILTLSFILFVNQCLCQNGFPKQFQATLNISALSSWPGTSNIQNLLYDYTNLRARFDITGWSSKQPEAYMLIFKPDGAEPGSLPSTSYTMFNFNPDYPSLVKNKCWYRASPMGDIGPFPATWYGDTQESFKMLPWFPLPNNLVNKGQEWVPEIQAEATRYDSQTICNLRRSGIGLVPCLSYFETSDGPVKTIVARAAVGSYDADDYTITVYTNFKHGIPSEAEQLFDLPKDWPAYCGNANAGFQVEPIQGFVVTPTGNDEFSLKLTSPPVRTLGDEIKIVFQAEPNWYYNATKCVHFNPIVFNKDNWQQTQKVTMSFDSYGCCSYIVKGIGGGYEWQYNSRSITVYACEGKAGYGCDGKSPCGA